MNVTHNSSALHTDRLTHHASHSLPHSSTRSRTIFSLVYFASSQLVLSHTLAHNRLCTLCHCDFFICHRGSVKNFSDWSIHSHCPIRSLFINIRIFMQLFLHKLWSQGSIYSDFIAQFNQDQLCSFVRSFLKEFLRVSICKCHPYWHRALRIS